MKEQLLAFWQNRSTLSSRIETPAHLEFPTINVCFDPATKFSVSNQYGFDTFLDKFHQNVPNTTLYGTFDNLSYKLGQDFEIRSQSAESFKRGLVTMPEKFGDRKVTFDVQPIRTYAYGTCYKLEPKFQMTQAPLRIELEFIINPTVADNDRPDSVVIHLTSNHTWIGLADNIWRQVKPLTESIDFKKEYTHIYTKVKTKKFNKEPRDTMNCLTNLFSQLNCSIHCDILSYTHLPLCQTAEELQCIWTKLYENQFTEYNDCYKTDQITFYKLIQRVENPLHLAQNSSSTKFYIGVWTMEEEMEEEVPLLTTEDFIGSIGGSLGMFFGFSFSASLFFCLNQIMKHFQ